MRIRAVSHIALGVPDMEAALPFYRDLLGLGVVVDRQESFVDPSTDPPVERTRRAVYLRWGYGDDSQFIVLDQQLSGAAAGAPAKLFALGLHHVAFWVDDLDALVAAAPGAGGRVVARPSSPEVTPTPSRRAAGSVRCTWRTRPETSSSSTSGFRLLGRDLFLDVTWICGGERKGQAKAGAGSGAGSGVAPCGAPARMRRSAG